MDRFLKEDLPLKFLDIFLDRAAALNGFRRKIGETLVDDLITTNVVLPLSRILWSTISMRLISSDGQLSCRPIDVEGALRSQIIQSLLVVHIVDISQIV